MPRLLAVVVLALSFLPRCALGVCVGDCNGDRIVTVDELLTTVNIALGNADVATCTAGDPNQDMQITIDEIVAAVKSALNSCAVPPGCVGDCNGDRIVTVDELLTTMNIALGSADAGICMAADANQDKQIVIDEILTAVSNALNGCPAEATATPTPTAMATTTPNPNDADLRVEFFGVSNSPPVGSGFGFFIRVTNGGPASASDVTAHFQVPAGYTLASAAPDPGAGTYDSTTGDWTIGALAEARFADLSFTVMVNPAGPYDLTATITGTSAPDANAANNTATVTVTPNANADLGIEIGGAPAAPPVGSFVGVSVRVHNNGPASTSNVTIHAPLPAGYTLTRAPDVSAGSYDSMTGDWSIGAMASNNLADLVFPMIVNPAGPYDLTATITGSSAPDPDPTNNSATALVTPNRNADLSISFEGSAPTGTVEVGKNITVAIIVNNHGPANTSDVTASFQVPAGYTLTGGPRVSVGSYDGTTGEWSIGAIDMGHLAELSFSATVNPTGPLGLTAAITGSSEPDPDLANNTVTAPPANRPPVADAGAHQTVGTRSKVALNGSLSSDADGDTLSFEWAFSSRPANSTAVLAGASTATPSFTADAPGTYTVQLTVSDGNGGVSATATVTIVANVLDQPPAITSEPVTAGTAQQPYRYDVHASDPDAGDHLTFSLPTAPLGMTIDSTTGVIQWTPAGDQGGRQAVTVRAQDQGGLSVTQDFTVQVSSPANHAPIAADDAYEVPLNESLNVPAPGVLVNDSDSDGDPLAATLLTRPTNGALDFNRDGSFTYTPHTLQEGELVLIENLNLAARVPGVAVTASTFVSDSPPEHATDDDLSTPWRFFGETGVAPVLEIAFPQGVTVTQLQLFGPRDPNLLANGLVFLSGIFQLFDTGGAVLFDSGVVDLPAPTHDAMLTIPNIPGVRRVRFTGVPTDAIPGSIAELKVIGSALVQRKKVVPDENLAQLLPVTVRASGSLAGNNIPENAIDDNTSTSWYSAGSGSDFLEIVLPVDATVTKLQTANPSARPDGFGSSLPILCTGTFQLFDVSDTVLFDSGVVNTPFNDRGLGPSLFSLAVPSVASVRRVRYTVSSCAGSSFPAGFSEFRIFGSASVTAPAFSLARKFQALVGREVHSTTVVANLTDDNGDGKIDEHDTPDIVVPVETVGKQITGEIKVVSGDDGRELFTAGGPNLVSPWSEVAVGDIDSDGLPDIVAVHSDGNHLIAFDHTGQVKWISDPNPMPIFPEGPGLVGGAVVIANLDGGVRPHIVVGASVFDSNGKLLGDGRTLGGSTGGTGLRSAMSAVADLDLDGTPEIVAGPTAYRLVNHQLIKVWQRADRPDGYVAIGNFDDDPFPEIVVVADGQIYMVNHDGTDAEVWNPPTHAPLPIPGGSEAAAPPAAGQAGPPLIVDVDGDGIPEIGIATAINYILFNRDGTVRWKSGISDHSSHSTGSVAFDFDGDGKVEIVYRDEQSLRIFRGADGVLLAKIPVGSSTWAEEPVVADVDNDGHADIVVSSNGFGNSALTNTGVHVFQDVANKWTRTRRIWNQHSYHITNVNEDGTIPRVETPNWLVPGLNNFRVNAFVPGETADQADSFTYKATDGSLDSNAATVRITIRPPNSPPRITSTAPTNAAEGLPYLYGVQAIDPDPGDVLTFSLPTAPAGMSIDPKLGLIQWTPTGSQLGSQNVVVKVQDVRGTFALQGYTVQVSIPVVVPNVVAQPQGTAATLVSSAGLTVGTVAHQNSPTVPSGNVISQNPAAATLVAHGSAVNIVVSLGPAPTDTPTSTPTNTPTATNTAPPTPTPAGPEPVAEITSPADGSTVTAKTNVMGTASSGTLASWTLAVRLAGDATFTTLATASTSVTDGVLGSFDPTLLLNGIYELELTVVDVSGREAFAVTTVAVDGNQKVGTFGLSYLDVSVPLVGFPIQITRTYDSRDKRTGDFGVGWSLGLRNVRLQENSVLGLDWTGTRQFVNFCLEAVRPHVVTVTLPDNSVHQFDAGVNPHCQGLSAPDQVSLTFTARPNTTSTLEPVDVTSALVFGAFPGDVQLLDFDTLAPVNLNVYKLTLPDGRAFIIDQQAGLQSITDLNGNVLTVTADGITHSSGTGVSFQRDAHGRIIKVTDPIGHFLTYSYNTAGDLASVTDQLGLTTTFAYNNSHGLLAIRDPLGRQPTRYEYDAEGRLIGVTDASGHTVTLSHNLATSQDVITDRQGNVTVLAYDARGNVAQRTDPFGHVTAQTYDSRDNKLSETDPLGNTRTFTYDTSDNLLTETDALGNVTTHTYNNRNQELTRTDPRAASVAFTYDSDGHLLNETDALGNMTTHTYDSHGNRISTTDPLGGTSTYVYDGRGNQIHITDALGNSTDATFDANGNQQTETASRIVDGAPQTVARSFEYDARNRVTRVIDPEGGVTHMAYTATGRLASTTDPLGHVTTYDYDDQDRLTTTTYPDGTTELFGYDLEGRVASQTDRAGRVTTFAYDAAGRQVSTTYPDGAVTHVGYDAADRRQTETDENGGAITTTYDAAARTIGITNQLGGSTSFTYDAAGNRISQTDRNGHTTTFTHDLAGRRTRTTFADSSFTSTTYDALGGQLTATDPAGHVTHFAYDAQGNLATVTDALNGVTRYAYDELRRRISQTDALGNVTRFTYDRNGRQLTRTLPLGQAESRTYDAAGNLTSLTDENGQSTTFTYDAMNRLLRRALPAENHDFIYAPIGKLATLTDAHGTTTFAYDLRDRPVLVHEPDGTAVGYAYDAHGNRTKLTTPGGTTTYSYDAAHRMTAVLDPQNHHTTFAYDAQGNRTGVTYANGVAATYAYDPLDRLTNLSQKNGSTTVRSYAYTLGQAGNRTRVVENTGRQVDYAYDALFRLTQEQVTPPGGAPSTTSYAYDAHGNRLSRTDAAGTTTFTYDANSRLLAAAAPTGTTSFTHDANGNLLAETTGGNTTSYQYDALNRLLQATLGGTVVQFTYDGLNNRVRRVSATSTTNFLVDSFGHGGTGLPADVTGRDTNPPAGLPLSARPQRMTGLPQVLRETDGAGAAVTDYVYGGPVLVSQQQAGGASFFLPDGQRSTRALANVGGAVTDTYEYDAFGQLLARTGATPNVYLYTGEQLDPNLGFYYLRARYYDPQRGRFTTRDPFAGRVSNPGTLHPYIYAANDPINHSDPTGQDDLLELNVAASIEGDLSSIATSAVSLGENATAGIASAAASAEFEAAATVADLTLEGAAVTTETATEEAAIVSGEMTLEQSVYDRFLVENLPRIQNILTQLTKGPTSSAFVQRVLATVVPRLPTAGAGFTVCALRDGFLLLGGAVRFAQSPFLGEAVALAVESQLRLLDFTCPE